MMRHGEAENNTEKIYRGRTDGVRLTEHGKRQAARMAAYAAGLGIAEIYSSPLERAAATATIVSDRISVAVKTENRLRERYVGYLAGRTHEAVREECGEWGPAYWQGDGSMTRQFKVEPARMIMDRVEEAAAAIMGRHRGMNVLLVTHSEPMTAALCRLAGMEPLEAARVRIPNASIISFGGDGTTITGISDGEVCTCDIGPATQV